MGCPNKAKYRYTWPGNDEAFICESHSLTVRALADCIGCHIQMIPLDEGVDEICHQQTNDNFVAGDD